MRTHIPNPIIYDFYKMISSVVTKLQSQCHSPGDCHQIISREHQVKFALVASDLTLPIFLQFDNLNLNLKKKGMTFVNGRV